MKKRLLVWGDSPNCQSGFGKVSKNLFSTAHKYYDVAFLGINEMGIKRYNHNKYHIYSVDPQDPFGFQRLPYILDDFKPTEIFLFQDIFNIQYALNIIRQHPEHKNTPITIYFPTDGEPFSQHWGQILKDQYIKKVFVYSEYANTVVPHTGTPYEILYHGVDTDSYKLLSEEQRTKIRETLGWTDKFTLINVNRFQPRKLIPTLLQAVALVINGYIVCPECGHYYTPDNHNYCPLNKCTKPTTTTTTQTKPNPNIALYLHMNTHEPTMGPKHAPTSHLASHALNAGFKDEHLNKNIFFTGRNLQVNPYTEKELNNFYNAADYNITTTVGEGCGLSLLESMATGTSTIAPNNSVVSEMLGHGHGHKLVKNATMVTFPNDSGHIRPIVSLPHLVKAIEEAYDEWVANGKKKVINHSAITRVNTVFNWEDKRQQMLRGIK